jgi:Uma2 family endonuclease
MEIALREKVGADFLIRSQLPLALALRSEPEPDIAVVPGTPRVYKDAHPSGALLVVEISDESLGYDRLRKGSLYSRAGVQEYWIVNLLESCLEVYRDAGSDGYRTHQVLHAGETVAPLLAPSARINIDSILP